MTTVLPTSAWRRTQEAIQWPPALPVNEQEHVTQAWIDRFNDLCTQLIRELKLPLANWDKVQRCTQKAGEEPAEYLERLKRTCKLHTGFENNDKPPWALLVYLFIEGLLPKVQGPLKTAKPDWRGLQIQDLMMTAQHIFLSASRLK